MSFAVTNVATSSSGTPNINLAEVAGTPTSVNNGTADAGTQRVVIASDNDPIAVTIGSTAPKFTANTFAEITSLASGTETTIVTYTAPVGKDTYLLASEASGTNIAQYTIYVNASAISKSYTYFGGNLKTEFDFRTTEFDFPGLKVSPGDVLTIKVLHGRPSLGDFNARLLAMEIG